MKNSFLGQLTFEVLKGHTGRRNTVLLRSPVDAGHKQVSVNNGHSVYMHIYISASQPKSDIQVIG